VVEDTDFDFDGWKLNGGYNVILVGGPVVNTIVDSLVGEGLSQVVWKTSKGEGEYFVDVYGNGCHILIIAGADRDTTQSAVKALIQWI
jgi:S-layer protein (TIGR01564 family)